MANRYWVGGTGNWTDNTNHWSDTSGGFPGVSLPTSSDNVIFDSNSHTTSYTVTINSSASCADMTWSNPASGTPTLAGSFILNLYGSLSLVSGMTSSLTSSINFLATSGTKTITSNGVTLTGIILNGAGGTFQLSDNITVTTRFSKTQGTFDANSKTITFTGSNPIVGGGMTFYNLTIQTTASVNDEVTITSSSNTVTNNLTITGNSIINRPLIKSDTVGTQTTITCTGASVNYSNCDFQDIRILNGTLGTNSNVGDCGGNTGITFSSAVDQHWQNANGGNWSTTANWTSRVPFPQDDVFMDKAFGTAKTVTTDVPRLGKTVDWTGATWTTSLTFNKNTQCSIFGSYILISGLTITSVSTSIILTGRSNYNITSNGVTHRYPITINAPSGTYTLQDNLSLNQLSANGTINHNGGTFDFNDFNVTTDIFNSNSSSTRILNMGSGTLNLNSNSTAICSFSSTGFTLNAETSTIKITNGSTTRTFAGGDLTFYNLWFTGSSSGAVRISGSNTFNDLKDDVSVAHTLQFTTGTTQTVSTFTVSGTAGNLITINSTTTGTHNLVKTGGGTISRDYLNIQHSIASPANTWLAGLNSVNNQSVATAGSGWIFSNVIPSSGMMAFFN